MIDARYSLYAYERRQKIARVAIDTIDGLVFAAALGLVLITLLVVL
jgi:predicted hydrolase (HD superfamily)